MTRPPDIRPRLGSGDHPPLGYLEPSSDDLKLGEIWAGAVRNRWTVLACLVVAAAAAVGYTLRQTPTYEGTATLRVQERELNISDIYQTVATGVAGSDLGTEMEVLDSRALREAAARKLALQVQLYKPSRVSRSDVLRDIVVQPDAQPATYNLVRLADNRFAVFVNDSALAIDTVTAGRTVSVPGATFSLSPGAIAYDDIKVGVQALASAVDGLEGGLSIDQPRHDAYIVTLTYSTTDSLLARDVPNAIVTEYLARRQENQTADARTTADFLQDQLSRVSEELSSAEDDFRAYQERGRVLDPTVQTNAEVERLTTKEASLTEVIAERDALRASVAQIEASAKQPGGPSPYRQLIGLPFLLRNQAASALLSNLVTSENDRAALVRSTPKDPDAEVLTARIADLEKQLHSITTTYLDGLDQQVQSMTAELSNYQQQLGAIPAKQLQFARLERKVKSLEDIHDLLESKLKESEIAEAARDASVQVVDTANAPTGPTGPNLKLNLAVALAFGLVLGGVVAIVREFRDKSVHTRKDILLATGVPVLGLIPRMRQSHGRVALMTERRPTTTDGRWLGRHRRNLGKLAAVSLPSGRSPEERPPSASLTVSEWGRVVAEAYGILQTNLAFANPRSAIKVVVVTSPLPEDGKTTCAINLAISLALRGSKVLLIDADLRRGVVHAAMDAPRDPGLADALVGEVAPEALVRSISVGPEKGALDFVTTGKPVPNPSGLLESAFGGVLASLRDRYDTILIDSPPVNIISDACILGVQADGVLLVARSGLTQSASLAYATEQLVRVGVPLLGAVLNDIDWKREAGYDSAYRQYTKSGYLNSYVKS